MEKIIARERLVRWNENLKIFHEKKQSQKNFDRAREISFRIGYMPSWIHPLLYYPPYNISLLYYSSSIRNLYYIRKSTFMSFLQHSNTYDHESYCSSKKLDGQ